MSQTWAFGPHFRRAKADNRESFQVTENSNFISPDAISWQRFPFRLHEGEAQDTNISRVLS